MSEQIWGYIGGSEPKLPDDSPLLQRVVLLTCLAVDRAGRNEDRPVEEALGCGFVLQSFRKESSQDYIVVCTAYHLLIEAEKHLRPDSARVYGGPFSPQPLTILGKDLWRIHGVLPGRDPNALTCQAVSASVFPQADLACLLMTAPPRLPGIGPQPLMLVDSDPPKVGSPVTIIGAPHASIVAQQDEGTRTKASFRLGWEARVGRITRLVREARLIKAPCYETNIPAPGAMSGGPVLLTTFVGGRAQIENVAIGMLSHDLPHETGQSSDCYVAGCSYVVPAILLHGLSIPPGILQGSTRSLREYRCLTDVGKRASEIEVQFEPEFFLRRKKST